MAVFSGFMVLVAVILSVNNLIPDADEKKSAHSEKAIIGNGWGVYEGEYVEGRYDF